MKRISWLLTIVQVLFLVTSPAAANTVTATQAGQAVDVRARHGRYKLTPLHSAAMKNKVDEVVSLLEAGAPVDAKDSRGKTALYFAAANGHAGVVALLLERGANVNMPDNDGKRPLHGAAQRGRVSIIHQLLAAGADRNLLDNKGKKAIHWARGRAVAALQEQPARWPEQPTRNANDALLYAARIGDLPGVQKALREKANKNTFDRKFAETALHRAVREGHEAVVQHLLAIRANTEAENISGETPLMHAVRYKRPTIVRLLLHAGANANAETPEGYSVLDLARPRHNAAIIKMLEDAGAKSGSGSVEPLTF